MNQVTLHSDGSLTADGRTAGLDPFGLLGYQIVLKDVCTLRSYFLLLERYPELLRLSAFFQGLMDQYRHCPVSDCLWDDFEALALSKTVEMVGYPGMPRLDIYNALQGIVPQTPDRPAEIRAIPLARLLDLPLRLGALNHVVFGDRMDTFTYDTAYTLFEFIDSIAWALSFHGTPEQCLIRS